MKLIRHNAMINDIPIAIHTFDDIESDKTPEDFASFIEEDEEIGFAGFSKRKHLTNILRFYDARITGESWVNVKDVLNIIKDSLVKCIRVAPVQNIRIFVFPTSYDFIKEKMGGVSGACFWKNTMLVFIHENSDLTALLKTIVHEYAHAFSLNFLKRETLQDHIVFEGVAENFVDSITGGKPNPWATALNKEESKRIFQKLKSKMNSKRNDLYEEVFFGTGQYPLWAGYSIGYHLVSDYLRKIPETNWPKILKTPTEEFLFRSGWM